MQQNSPNATGHPPGWVWLMFLLLPIFSCGCLAFVPSLVVASLMKQRRHWWWAGGLSFAMLSGLLVAGAAEEGSAASNAGVALYFGAALASFIYSLVMVAHVPWPLRAPQLTTFAPPPPVAAPDPNATAILQVQESRRKRDEARELVQRDPGMARDLKIGRPDLARQFDDGGLVDINHAPAEVFVQALGLSPAQADAVIEARTHLGDFRHPDDLVHLAGVAQAHFDKISDRVILL